MFVYWFPLIHEQNTEYIVKQSENKNHVLLARCCGAYHHNFPFLPAGKRVSSNYLI